MGRVYRVGWCSGVCVMGGGDERREWCGKRV